MVNYKPFVSYKSKGGIYDAGAAENSEDKTITGNITGQSFSSILAVHLTILTGVTVVLGLPYSILSFTNLTMAIPSTWSLDDWTGEVQNLPNEVDITASTTAISRKSSNSSIPSPTVSSLTFVSNKGCGFDEPCCNIPCPFSNQHNRASALSVPVTLLAISSMVISSMVRLPLYILVLGDIAIAAPSPSVCSLDDESVAHTQHPAEIEI
jgi:hypothetical protein